MALSSEAGTQDDLARELPRIKPLELAATLTSFRIHSGFHLEQVAAEPMVINFLKTCATCHRVRGEGVEVGPNLATVAGRSPDNLLLHILDPNREVAPNCVNYNVVTTDGRTISGIIASESATALTLKRALGVTEVVPRGQIEAFASSGLSLMPEGLEKELTTQDLADLMAFVKSIQHSPASPGHQPGR